MSLNCPEKFLYKSVKEFPDPVVGKVTKGKLPEWINGRLMRNGPGLFEFGETSYDHLFDGMALLHSWTIKDGAATYRSRFLQSETYKKNKAANRIVVGEFGTASFPDPCSTIFEKFSTFFKAFNISDMTDNAVVTIYPMGDDWVASTETDIVSTFDPETLEIKDRFHHSHNVAVNMATAHAMFDPDGTVHNMGNSFGMGGSNYNIIRFDPPGKGENPFSKGKVVCSIPARWQLNPCYYHSFVMSENYYVFLEQPLAINVATLMKAKIANQPFAGALKFYPEESCRFHIVDKKDGKVLETVFNADNFFCFHHVNAYEEEGHVVVDLIAYEDDSIMDSLYFKELMKENKSGENFHLGGEIRRYVFPLYAGNEETNSNMVNLPFTTATAEKQPDNSIFLRPEILLPSGNGIELPVINYRRFNGLKYRFCYGLGIGRKGREKIDIVKFNVETKEETVWSQKACFPAEPIFVPRPGATEEDDGVLLSPVVDLSGLDFAQTPTGSDAGDSTPVVESAPIFAPPFLLILDAKTMTEVARVEFEGVEWHRDIHGVFQPL